MSSLLIFSAKGSSFTYTLRKDVSLHSALLIRPSVASGRRLFGGQSSKGLQLMPGAVTDCSELTDVRSVLRSNDVQDESEEKEELVSTHSSNSPCLEPIATTVRQTQLCRETNAKRAY